AHSGRRLIFMSQRRAEAGSKALPTPCLDLLGGWRRVFDGLPRRDREDNALEIKFLEAIIAAARAAKFDAVDGLVSGSATLELKGKLEGIFRGGGGVGGFGGNCKIIQKKLKKIGRAIDKYQTTCGK